MTLDGPLLSLDAAAALLGIRPRTLRRLAACGAVPVRHMGRLLRFAPSDVARAQALGLPTRTEIEARRPLPHRGRPGAGTPIA